MTSSSPIIQKLSAFQAKHFPQLCNESESAPVSEQEPEVDSEREPEQEDDSDSEREVEEEAVN